MSEAKHNGSYLQVFPVNGTERCQPGAHDGWAVNKIDANAHAIYAGTIQSDRVPAEVLKEIFDAYPEVEGKVQVQWQSTSGALEQTDVSDPLKIMDELMVVVSDETPDDAENTDDHPLEEMRSILMDVDELMNETPEPA
ncbi:hypothetical protein LCGC14_2168550 [marine sediment metagenome]|uniref:Uncharacterized protein n=1 Tax=marine sediment metagenome TaxID=412755 RepID=A0A0F9DQK5_9ZZZZ